MNLVDMVSSVIGPVSPGWEFLYYIAATIVFFFGFVFVANLALLPLKAVLGIFGRRRL